MEASRNSRLGFPHQVGWLISVLRTKVHNAVLTVNIGDSGIDIVGLKT